MNNKFTGIQAVGKIVTEFPQASEIFKKYRIDFCCGGDKLLAVAAKELNIDEKSVLEELNQSYTMMAQQNNWGEEVDWRQQSLSQLVDHIINKHHLYLQHEMPLISEFVTTILRVHGVNHSELGKVHKLFHTLKLELDQHLIKEEEILFPLIKKYEQNPSSQLLANIKNQIHTIENEHEQAGDIIKELRQITNEYALPTDACTSYRLAYQKLEEMESDLFQHIHLENNILHPRIQSRT